VVSNPLNLPLPPGSQFASQSWWFFLTHLVSLSDELPCPVELDLQRPRSSLRRCPRRLRDRPRCALSRCSRSISTRTSSRMHRLACASLTTSSRWRHASSLRSCNVPCYCSPSPSPAVSGPLLARPMSGSTLSILHTETRVTMRPLIRAHRSRLAQLTTKHINGSVPPLGFPDVFLAGSLLLLPAQLRPPWPLGRGSRSRT
jgi:hypothetical protein